MHLGRPLNHGSERRGAKQKEDPMKMRMNPAAMVATVCLLAAPGLLAAPLLTRTNPKTVQSAKVNRIAFQLRNDSGAEMTVQAGERSLVLSPGKTLAVKLPTGQSLTAAQATGHYAEGEILAVVSSNLSGNVLVFH